MAHLCRLVLLAMNNIGCLSDIVSTCLLLIFMLLLGSQGFTIITMQGLGFAKGGFEQAGGKFSVASSPRCAA